ncbi:MAG: efflux transporter outer membrane subunit [Alphaproteobacteria bacterium]|nr:MAG: efflux transporter outer membrane subunit [Alphaproteobacteria bacterium]
MLPNPSRKTLLPLLAATVLAGCAVGPDYKKPDMAVPAAWGAAEPAAAVEALSLSHWWTRLGDDQLNSLVEEAVTGNLDVAAAKARIREARASYRQAFGAQFPEAGIAGSATRAKTGPDSVGGTGSSGDPYSSYRAGLDASWEVDLFGANRRAAEAARYGLDAAEQDLRSTLLSLIGDVALNYVEARGYQARISLAERTAKSQKETAGLTKLKFQAGSTSAVDVANAAGLAAGTEAGVAALKAAFASSVHRLSVLTGKPPVTLMDRLRDTAPIPAPDGPVATGIPANILMSRPDVQIAERQYAQATARVGQAMAARYPSISLTGSINTSAFQIGDLGKNSTVSWSFGPSINIPLFNAGQLKAAVDIAEAQRDQYFISYQQAVLGALEDVENAIVSFSRERERYQGLATSARAYQEANRLSQLRYKHGSSSFLDVLDAERALYSAEDSLLQSRVAITSNFIALNKALGGGWDGEMDAGEPLVKDTGTGPHMASFGNQ